MTEEFMDEADEIIQEDDGGQEAVGEVEGELEKQDVEGAGEVVGEGDVEQEEEIDLETVFAELDDLKIKSAEYLDGWQRERAEFTNYKKRMEREREQQRETIKGNVIRGYLEIVDDLELALKNRPTEGDGASWSQGIELVYRKLLGLLESEGVQPMQADGQQFDPNLHEAISQEPREDLESGQIIEVVKNGYFIGERLLRPAKVRVAR